MNSKWRLGALFVCQETTFGVDPDDTGAAYTHMFAREATFQPEAEVIERPGLTGEMTRQPHVVGVRGGKLSFKLELKGNGVTNYGLAVNAASAEAHPILEASIGSASHGRAGVLGVGSTTTSLVYDPGVSYVPLNCMVFVEGELRHVIAKPTTTTLTLDRALASTPSTGGSFAAATTYIRQTVGHKTLSFVVKRDTIQYTFLGCKTSFKIEGITARGVAMLSFEVDVADWLATTKSSLPSTNLTGITAVKPPVVKGAQFAVAGVAELVSGLDFDPGLEHIFQETTEGLQAKSAAELVNSNPRGSFKPYFADGHMATFLAETEVRMVFACGTKENGWGLHIAKAQLLQPTMEDRGGLVGENIPFAVNDPGTGVDWVLNLF